MKRPSLRFRSRRLRASLASAVLILGITPFLAPSAGAAGATFTPALDCPPENYPAPGSPRSAADNPYEAPFTASLGVAASNADGGDGGFITVDAPGSLAQITLGPPDAASSTGTLFGEACGTFNLPSLLGTIPARPAYGHTPNGAAAPGGAGNSQYNNNFILHGAPFGPSGIGNPINVGLAIAGLGINITTLKGTGSADGIINNQLSKTSAANGGLDISFMTTAKVTAVVNPAALASLIPVGAVQSLLGTISAPLANALGSSTGGECTLSLGDQDLVGYGASTTGYTSPATLSTTNSGAGGKPATGPISDTQSVAAAAGIPQPPISPNATPDPSAPGAGTTAPSSLCNASIAGLLNKLLGLPYLVNGQPGGVDKFVAPLTVRALAPE